MRDIIMKAIELAIMIVAFACARYLIPWLKTRIGADQMQQITGWVKAAVLSAQQVLQAESGETRKAWVVDFLHDILTEKGFEVSEEEIDTLIEAAVKEMKISEGAVSIHVDKDTGPKKTEPIVKEL